MRDPDGDEVWCAAKRLEERRTVYVPETPCGGRRVRTESSQVYLMPGVIGAVTACVMVIGGESPSAGASVGCRIRRSGAENAPVWTLLFGPCADWNSRQARLP